MLRDDKELRSSIAISRRQWLALAGTAAGGLMSTALPFPGPAAAQTAKRGGVLQIVSPHNPTSMDPITGRHGNDHIMLFPVFETLINVNLDTLLPEPGLAKSSSNPDPKTLVLNLRSGITFHDGTPLDAEAVRFNLERARSDERSRVKIDMTYVQSIEVTGERQVTLKLSEPDIVLLAVLSDRAGMMSSPAAVKAAGERYDRAPVGTGPWRLTSWLDAEKLVYAQYNSYWNSKKKPPLEGLQISVIPEVNTALRTVIAKQNDFVFQLAPQQKPVAERAGLVLAQGQTVATYQIYLNFSKPPFDNLKVRLAMCHAVDRDQLNKLTMGGLAEPTIQTLPKSHWAYNKELEGTYRYDPELARKLLVEAGHPQGIDVEMFIYNDQRSQQRGEVLIEQYKKANIRIIMKSVPVNELGAKFMGERLGNAAFSVYTGRTDPSQFFSIMFDPKSFINPSRMWGAPGLEQAMADCRTTFDLEGRKKAIGKVLKILNDNALYVPLVLQPEVDAMSTRVKGFKPNMLGKPRFEEVYLEG